MPRMTHHFPAALLLFVALFPRCVSPQGGLGLRVSKPSYMGPYAAGVAPAGDPAPWAVTLADLRGSSLYSSTNLALNQATNSSSSQAGAAPSLCVDGSLTTFCSTSNSSTVSDTQASLVASVAGMLPVETVVLTPAACCFSRLGGASVDLLDAYPAGAVVWGMTLPPVVTSAAAITLAVPQWAVRVSSPNASVGVALWELAAYDEAPVLSGSGIAPGSVLNASLGCRASSRAAPAAGCSACLDGNLSTACTSTGADASPWLVVSASGVAPPAFIVLWPAASLPGVLVEVVCTGTGATVWSATLLGSAASGGVGGVTVLRVATTVVLLSKPDALGPYVNAAQPSDTGAYVVAFSEVAGFPAGGGASLLAGSGAAASSQWPLVFPACAANNGVKSSSDSTHTSGSDANPWLAVFLPPLITKPLLTLVLTPRIGYAGRASATSVQVVYDWPSAPSVAWGTMLGPITAEGDQTLSLPSYSVRVSKPSGGAYATASLVIGDVSAFSVSSAVNRALGGACSASSVVHRNKTMLCAACVDGNASTLCTTSAEDASPWTVFALAGAEPVASVVLAPHASAWGSLSGALVEIVVVGLGRVAWSATVGVLTNAAPVTLVPQAAPYAVVVAKPGDISYADPTNCGTTVTYYLNVGEVQAFSADGVNRVLYLPSWMSSNYGGGLYTAPLGNNGDVNDFIHTATGDTNPSYSVATLDASTTISRIVVTPRRGSCWGRMTGARIALTSTAATSAQFPWLTSWGVTLGTVNSAADLTWTVPTFSVRFAKPALFGPYVDGFSLNLAEVGCYSVGSATNRCLGQPAWPSSVHGSGSYLPTHINDGDRKSVV